MWARLVVTQYGIDATIKSLVNENDWEIQGQEEMCKHFILLFRNNVVLDHGNALWEFLAGMSQRKRLSAVERSNTAAEVN